MGLDAQPAGHLYLVFTRLRHEATSRHVHDDSQAVVKDRGRMPPATPQTTAAPGRSKSPAKPKRPRFARLRAAGELVRTLVLDNPLLAGLGAMAAVLLLMFFIGLSVIAPHSRGTETSLSGATQLIQRNGVVDATLRDQDSRVELVATDGRLLWATYPHADSYTGRLLTRDRKSVV
jgi:hypothetical protein